MKTKKQRKRTVVRRMRRMLKDVHSNIGFRVSGRRLNKMHYGQGIGRLFADRSIEAYLEV